MGWIAPLTEVPVKEVTAMALTRVERERVSDSQMKIRSIAQSLQHVDPKKIPDFEVIEKCLDDADRSLRGALRESESELTDAREL